MYKRLDQKSVITTLLAVGVVATTAFFVYRKLKNAKNKHRDEKLEEGIVFFIFLSRTS